MTASSNLLGTRPDIRRSPARRTAPAAGRCCYVDGVHFTAHCPVDLAELGADFFACSPYKFLGPHCGVLGRSSVAAGGTAAGQAAAVDRRRCPSASNSARCRTSCWRAPPPRSTCSPGSAVTAASRRERVLAGMAAVEQHEERLRGRVEAGVDELPGVTRYSRAARRTPTTLLTFADRPAQAAYEFLAERGVNAPASSFYALEASRRLGLGDEGGLRVGLAPYSNDERRRPVAGRSRCIRAQSDRRPGRRGLSAASDCQRAAAPDRWTRAPSDRSPRSAAAAPDR